MPTNAYKLNFPCPGCGGMITMCVKSGIGHCPICTCTLSASLHVTIMTGEKEDPIKLGWDKRAFRRPTTTSKPIWQPLHEPVK